MIDCGIELELTTKQCLLKVLFPHPYLMQEEYDRVEAKDIPTVRLIDAFPYSFTVSAYFVFEIDDIEVVTEEDLISVMKSKKKYEKSESFGPYIMINLAYDVYKKKFVFIGDYPFFAFKQNTESL